MRNYFMKGIEDFSLFSVIQLPYLVYYEETFCERKDSKNPNKNNLMNS